MKRIITIFFVLIWILIGIGTIQQVQAETDIVNISVLERHDCAHCIDEKAFLTELKESRNDISVTYLDIYEEENRTLFNEIAELKGLSKSTPITLIGNTIIQGFDTPETTGKTFLSIIDATLENLPEEDKDLTFEKLLEIGETGNIHSTEGGTCGEDAEECVLQSPPIYVKIPFYGPVDIQEYALPTMSLVLGFIDGFNPCAMWALVTFILILMQVGDRKRMWQLVGIFLLAQAIMYYLILNVWLTVWDFVGLDNIVTPIIGVVAISAGIFFLYKYFTYKGTCTVTNAKDRKETQSRMQRLATGPFTFAVILGIIGIALSINIIEFACSIGIPQTFTKILDLNPISFMKKQFYMGLYMLMYMIDDLFVFVIALVSMEKIGLTTKYANLSSLIGGVLMLILGLIMLIKPELLIF